MTKPEFMILARKMFDRQFPNTITMDKPRFDCMSSEAVSIKEELWECPNPKCKYDTEEDSMNYLANKLSKSEYEKRRRRA